MVMSRTRGAGYERRRKVGVGGGGVVVGSSAIVKFFEIEGSLGLCNRWYNSTRRDYADELKQASFLASCVETWMETEI